MTADVPECHCDEENAPWCEVHVSCDDRCKALENPTTDDETDAALEHWKNHSFLSGCSHGS